MSALKELKRRLIPGQVYRRADIAALSGAADRYLRQLVEADELRKPTAGVYYRPRKSAFGNVPADERKIIAAFLKDNDFLVVSLNSYNTLGVGTTQLYNERLVYNRKRDGRFYLDGQRYYFLKNRKFPGKVTEPFLLVDLVNNMDLLAEDRDALKDAIARKALELGATKVSRAARAYGKTATKKYLKRLLEEGSSTDAR